MPASSARRESSTASSGGEKAPPESAPLSEEQKSFWNARKLKLSARSIDIWALGITIVIGGQYFGWNISSIGVCGWVPFAVATAAISIGYITLCFSLAEMTSSMPFAGGAYGFARVCQGTYLGYVVGCFETLEYIFYVASAVLSIGQMITEIARTPKIYEPIWWGVFYVTALAIHIQGGTFFWRFNLFAAVLCVVISCIYILGVAQYLDFPANAPMPISAEAPQPWYYGGVSGFLTALPNAAWWYIGVECLGLASEETFEPKRSVARGQVACVLTLFATCVGTLFSTTAITGGSYMVSHTLLVYNEGFSRMFGIDKRWAVALSLPACWATAFGFIFCYGRQMFAMARSGLFPMGIALTTKKNGSPYVALILGSAAAFLITAAGWYFPSFASAIFPVCITGASVVYLIQLRSYLILRTHYPNIKREFTSPFGKPGAYVCGLVWAVTFVGAVAFQGAALKIGCVLVGYYVLISVYYLLVSRHQQIVSPEEEAVLFVAYVIRSNQRRAKKQKSKLTKAGIFGSFSSKQGSGKGAASPDDKAIIERIKEREKQRAASQAISQGLPHSPAARGSFITPTAPQTAITIDGTKVAPTAPKLGPTDGSAERKASGSTTVVPPTQQAEQVSKKRLSVEVPPEAGAVAASAPLSPTGSEFPLSPSNRSGAPTVVMSPKRAEYLTNQFGFLGRLLVFLYSFLICCCARYDVEVDVEGEFPVGKDGKVDSDVLSGTLRGQLKMKQDRAGVNSFFRRLLVRSKKVKPHPPTTDMEAPAAR